MNKLRRTLRAGFFPLLVALGVAALAAGYFEWKRFFGELYLEEMQAIEAAVAAGAEVEYRRAGEPRSRVASRSTDWQGKVVDSVWERERTTVPGNAPFLGRVESIKLRERGLYGGTQSPTKAVRDAMLRLPGLRSFEGLCDRSASSGSGSPRVASSALEEVKQALGQMLPALPEPALTVKEIDAPLPHGEPVDPSARDALAAEIAARWDQARPLGAYLARAAHRPGESEKAAIVVTEIADEERFLSRIDTESLLKDPFDHARWSSKVSKLEPFGLLNADRAFAFREIEGERYRTATLDRTAGPNASEIERFAPRFLTPETLPRLNDEGERFGLGAPLSVDQDDPLGEMGGNVDSIERIDDVRLRLDLAPQSATVWNGPFERRVEMIVREDFDFAVERFNVHLEPAKEDSQRYRLIVSVARRLARAGEAIYAQETLRYQRAYLLKQDADKPERGSEASERTLTTIVAAPEIPAAVFDPLTYDPTAWPEPRELPAIRNYRTLWSLGAGLIAVGTIGPLFLRFSARRPFQRVEGAPSSAEDAPARLPRFRFGLAALFAAALAMISAAGAIKQVRDVVTRDVETLRRFEGWGEIERHEASFPWSLFSTPAFPLDAPLKRISISSGLGQQVSPVSDEVVRELVANPRLESFQDRSAPAAGRPREYVLADAAAALSRPLPELPEPIPPLEEALWLYKMPEGEPLAEEERTAFVERLTNAWQRMSADFPQRYLLVESHDHYGSPEARATLRSGARYWTMGGKDSVFVSSQDDRYRYRFGTRSEGSSLVERTRLGASPLESEAQNGSYGYASSARFGYDKSPFRIDQAGYAPVPPFAFPRYLYDGIESFDTVARAALDPTRIVQVSRLEGGRYRIDFDETEVELKGKAPDWGGDLLDWQDGGWAETSTDDVRVSVRVAELAIIVQEDLDFAVDRTFCKTSVYRRSSGDASRNDGISTVKSMPRRWLYATNRLMRTPEGIVVPKSSRVGDDQGGNRTWWDSRFAYDFAPEIDERIFSSPSLSDPEPYPAREERRAITWPLMTGGLSLAMFAGLGGRRIAAAIRRRKASGR